MSHSGDQIRQFGQQKAGYVYQDRPSVYGIAYNQAGEILVARTRGKLMLPGGGIHQNETTEQALHREVLEETGWQIEILAPICRANEYMISKRKARATNKLAQFFLMKPIARLHDPLDEDHEPLWIARKKALKKLHNEFFRWAVDRTEPSL